MKRKFVISDIHGEYQALERAIKYIEFIEPNAPIIFLGDYIDRGENGRKVIEMVKEYVERGNGSIALRGNHDQMLIDFARKGDTLWILNDRKSKTFHSLVGPLGVSLVACSNRFVDLLSHKDSTIEAQYMIKKDSIDLIEWLESLPLYHEDEHTIYVHANIDFWLEDWKQKTEKETMLWAYPPELYKNNVTGKTIVVGHVQAAEIWGKQHHFYEGIFYNKKTNTYYIDGSTPTSKTINILEITENGEYIEHNCI